MRRTFVVGRVDGKTTEIRLVESRAERRDGVRAGVLDSPFGAHLAVAAVVRETTSSGYAPRA